MKVQFYLLGICRYNMPLWNIPSKSVFVSKNIPCNSLFTIILIQPLMYFPEGEYYYGDFFLAKQYNEAGTGNNYFWNVSLIM